MGIRSPTPIEVMHATSCDMWPRPTAECENPAPERRRLPEGGSVNAEHAGQEGSRTGIGVGATKAMPHSCIEEQAMHGQEIEIATERLL